MTGLTAHAVRQLAVCREAVANAQARATPSQPFVCQVCGSDYENADTYPLCCSCAAQVWTVPGLRRRRDAELRMPPLTEGLAA